MKSESIPSHAEQSTQCRMVQSTEPIRVAEARRHGSEREHRVMASHGTQQLLPSVPQPRLEHQSEVRKEGGGNGRLQPKGTFLRVLSQASANV